MILFVTSWKITVTMIRSIMADPEVGRPHRFVLKIRPSTVIVKKDGEEGRTV